MGKVRLEFALSRLKAIEPGIGKNVIVGKNFSIGPGSMVCGNVWIGDNVTIGSGCIIKPGSVIGAKGFGFERDENGVPVRIEHDGGVVIGDDVEIGAINTVVSGTVSPTLVMDHTKTDDHVHIAHNCIVGLSNLFAAGVVISGGVVIGDCNFFGVNCCVKNKVVIGSWNIIGMGAVVINNISDYTTIIGNPGRAHG
jgi:UDP-3-O-[3-hydroxymyristoyl] glucosamine N-acyltransferase